jgi:hypothetical protein
METRFVLVAFRRVPDSLGYQPRYNEQGEQYVEPNHGLFSEIRFEP